MNQYRIYHLYTYRITYKVEYFATYIDSGSRTCLCKSTLKDCGDHSFRCNFFFPFNGRYAVVTAGANKGIGFEICRQLASQGIIVLLTARDKKRGVDAVELKESNDFSDQDLLFHQLDVEDSSSVASLAEFVKTQFGRLDILVNNAGIGGSLVDTDALKAATAAAGGVSINQVRFLMARRTHINWKAISTHTYELTLECVETNYCGTRRMVEALLPLLQLSQSPRIVNVSSTMGKLKDVKAGSQEAKGWPIAYSVSKAAIIAYTRILAKKLANFKVNCVCPGSTSTDLNYRTGKQTTAESAESPVMLALLPDDGPSGLFFLHK
ncbi:unnamed protein product [Coffea canephora]|uniref:Uncharacterized protein n=1 Tax=Coffea canephora TaxID=49390 RepID=A0A068VC15_COFCA|nr:unnamed protein product [Coffea canephora]